MEEQGTGSRLRKATFAGGCFWCMQPPFRMVEGVIEVVSGYAGGTKENPTYEEVSTGRTGYLEAVQVTYDPARVSYDTLLDTFWRQIDPTDAGGQFADRGSQYQTAIFYHDEEQRRLAEASKARLGTSGKFGLPLATEIRPFTTFYPAEEYHQDFDRKNPARYHEYKTLSGRESFLERAWKHAPLVRVYSTPGCTGCHSVKEFLKARHVEFQEINMAEDEEAQRLVVEKTGYLGSPVVQIGEEFIAGFDPKKMEQALRLAGIR